MNQELTILIGISGSGKTTFSTEYINKHSNTLRINRDDMRKELLGDLTQEYYSRKNHNLKTRIEKNINFLQFENIRLLLNRGFNVIVDNTHLKIKDIEEYKRVFGTICDIKLITFPIDKELAKTRVIKRNSGNIDTDYIDRQYNQFLVVCEHLGVSSEDKSFKVFTKRDKPLYSRDPKLPDCYIVDIDGTCANCEGVRSPYDGHLLHLDKPIEAMRSLLDDITYSSVDSVIPEIIYVSGREDKWEEATLEWLLDNSFPVDVDYVVDDFMFTQKIYMRKTGDTRKDYIVKEELIKENIIGKYNILGVFDDRYQVSDHLRDNLGLYVFQVNQKRSIF